MFGHMSADATIEGIGLVDAYVRGRSFVGALVGHNEGGTIMNSHTTTTEVIGGQVGSLVGEHEGIIDNSYTSGIVRGSRNVGGLVGYFRQPDEGADTEAFEIVNSRSHSTVRGGAFTGGLVGSNTSRIVNSYATGDVASVFNVGGLAGLNVGMITNTYATGEVRGELVVGGLVGDNRNVINNSYASGTVVGENLAVLVGALVGDNSGAINYSYSAGSSELSLLGRLLFGGTTMGSAVVSLAELQMQAMNEWDSEGAWYFEDGEYPALRYISTEASRGCERDMLCGALLGGQSLEFSPEQFTLPLCTTSIEFPDDGDEAPQAVDIDKDNNGLIEICDLEGLDEMRYVLDGSGYRADAEATVNTTGCPADGCIGYELTRSLDFNDDDSYRSPANRMAWTTGRAGSR